MKTHTLHVIGVDACENLTEKAMATIAQSRAVVLSRRHREQLDTMFHEMPALFTIPIAPVQEAIALIRQELEQGDVSVLATGDPLFFGIGRTLLQFIPPAQITFSPALSTMQRAFSRFKTPWDNAVFLSLHGREPEYLASQLRHDTLFLFTDQRSTPDRVARILLQECGDTINDCYTLHVAENLGSSQERLISGTLDEIVKHTFGPLTVMILQKNMAPASSRPAFGLMEDEIVHSRGLITKNEVRAACLHRLRLPGHGILWDIGAGSGSLGLEAARLFPELEVFAIEQHPEQLDNIRRNRQRFQTWNLHPVSGTAPEALRDLPAPDRIFIGGSGGQLQAIITHCVQRLHSSGRIVISAVLEKTVGEAPQFLADQGMDVYLSEINVTRHQWSTQHKQIMNPITIIVGQKDSHLQEKANE